MYNEEHADNNTIGLIVFDNFQTNMFILMFTMAGHGSRAV
jgi:hypothetical protein